MKLSQFYYSENPSEQQIKYFCSPRRWPSIPALVFGVWPSFGTIFRDIKSGFLFDPSFIRGAGIQMSGDIGLEFVNCDRVFLSAVWFGEVLQWHNMWGGRGCGVVVL